MSNSTICVYPLLGGKGDLSAISIILQLGPIKILLDCGLPQDLGILSDFILSEMKSVDLILLSHADNQHLGALPLLQGKVGNLSKPLPILCTLPVQKFGQMVLYDSFLNKSMEGKLITPGTTDSGNKNGTLDVLLYDLDDVDRSFSQNTYTVKYCQQISLESILSYLGYLDIGNIGLEDYRKVSFCAYSSGRTIGGAMWRIRYGQNEILYAMDIYLRKEIVLNGASVDLLPPSPPSLLIVEAGSYRRQHYQSILQNNRPSTLQNKKERDDYNRIIASVMITLREGGNILIPCDTVGRTLEYLQYFAKYWYENKLGLYHLIFLSHMSTNTFEYATSQLEWMTDTLSKGFYNGKPNPFDLKPLKLLNSIRELEKYSGPKVVFATDSSLSYGLSKELLLRWGGDPKNKIIFLDYSHEGSLAYEIRNQIKSPPIVVSITRPQRIELVGEELAEYKRVKEREKRLKDEATQRNILLKELNLLDAEHDIDNDDMDETDGQESIEESTDPSTHSIHTKTSDNKNLKRTLSEESSNKPNQSKRQKLLLNQIRRFTEPLYPMFQTQYKVYHINEYGVSNTDMTFKDIAPEYLINNKRNSLSNSLSNNLSNNLLLRSNPNSNPNSTHNVNSIVPSKATIVDSNLSQVIPHKIIAMKAKIQLTCQFYESEPISGTSDVKAIRGFISKVNPNKVIVLRGREVDCDAILSFANSRGNMASSLSNFQSINYTFQADRIRIHINQSLLTTPMKAIRSFNSSVSTTTNAGILSNTNTGITSNIEEYSRICPIKGIVGENPLESGKDSIRVVRLLDPTLQEQLDVVEVNEDDEDNNNNSNNNIKSDENTVNNDDGLGNKSDVTNLNAKDNKTMIMNRETIIDLNDITSYQDVDRLPIPETLWNDTITNVNSNASTSTSTSTSTNLTGGYPIKSSSSTATKESKNNVAAVSVGEIMLDKLKSLLEQQYNLTVEFRLGSEGGMLVCNATTIIRKENENDFIIEGPPSAVYYTVRKALYQQIAFI